MKGIIYYIKNIENDRVYIGQTIDLKKRKMHHLSTLRKGDHKSKPLQLDYDKYGEDVFIFGSIERTNNLDMREEYWINEQKNPYNKKLFRPKSKMDKMPTILRRIRQQGLSDARHYMDS